MTRIFISKFTKSIGVFSALIGSVGMAHAQATIDKELSTQIDFRAEAFSVCLGKPTCDVNGLSIRAERRSDDGLTWGEAEIYWDMVDGLGIRDGAQNDEIDFDERLAVTLSEPATVQKIWLSDIFRNEDGRYGSANTDRVEGVDIDTESAAIQLDADGVTVETVLVEANDRLPWASFNEEVTWRFQENGDLRRRVVIVDDVVRIVAPGPDGSGRITFDGFKIGEIDPEKKSIFEGVETVEIDLGDILAEFHDTDLFLVGTRNFELLRAMVEDPETLTQMRRVAETKSETRKKSRSSSWAARPEGSKV